MAYAINEAEAHWVRQIFRWFVIERQPIRWITRQLNKLGVPRDNRAKSSKWLHNIVIGILESEKYIRNWSWGRYKNVRDPLTGKLRQEPRAEHELNEEWDRSFPELRIIDDETFLAAQALAARIVENPLWLSAVCGESIERIREQSESVPSERTAAESQLKAVGCRINNMLDKIETGLSDPDVLNR